MNFLAHIYLSFDDQEITLGNFIADSIVSNKFKHLPEKVQKGILLHRAIDTYTDAHPRHKQSCKRLHTNHGHYSRVIVDIFYDHFLAKNWQAYSDIPLKKYTESFYKMVSSQFDILPEGVQRMMPYMMADNWLLNYAKVQGIGRVLNGMHRRTGHKSKMHYAVSDLENHYSAFEEEFTAFFDELIIFSRQKFNDLCED